ncbi:unnamed protein product [Meganyctiphanes norvegica]|uniref:Uncharacterized protein n=1 Tax=Meganyctiphanes norvegica TaxID=48144 RepID=A0AAV2R8Y8_MEGNR
MKSLFSILLLLCSSLVSTKQVPLEYGTNQNSVFKLPSDKAVRLDIYRKNVLSSNNNERKNLNTLRSDAEQTVPIPRTSSSFVHLPTDQIKCSEDIDCRKHDLPLFCGSNGLCECYWPLCWVYYVDSSTWPMTNVFQCGTCGSLGSTCNGTIFCEDPGQCMGDNFCHCRHGGEFDQDRVCWIADTSWTLVIAIWAMAIILFFAVIVMCYNLYVTRPWLSGCGRRRRPARDASSRHTLDTKTPAYTVQDFYGYPQSQGSPQAVQSDVQATDPPSMNTEPDHEVRENNNSELDTPVQPESTYVLESPESLQQTGNVRPDESSTDDSLRSSVSSSTSSINSERPLITTSGDSSTQNGHTSGFSIGRVFNRGQRRRDDHNESTRF